MSTTIEERVATLEKELNDLKQPSKARVSGRIGGKPSAFLPTTRDSRR